MLSSKPLSTITWSIVLHVMILSVTRIRSRVYIYRSSVYIYCFNLTALGFGVGKLHIISKKHTPRFVNTIEPFKRVPKSFEKPLYSHIQNLRNFENVTIWTCIMLLVVANVTGKVILFTLFAAYLILAFPVGTVWLIEITPCPLQLRKFQIVEHMEWRLL